ncbi:MAG TPA: hypothetical protein VFS39_00465 [Nitrospira sp.]|nr:hypothetical protein [Nitrospira sp.]
MVQEIDEMTGGIIFAKSAIEARKIGANEWNDGELAGMTVRRRKDLDQFAGSGVPFSLLIDEGWWGECTGCGGHIDEWFLYDRGLTSSDVIGTLNAAIFCCQSCKDEYAARKDREDQAGREFLKRLCDIVRRRFPNANAVTPEYVYAAEFDGVVTIRQAVVSFEFPGMKIAAAHLRYDPGHGIGPSQPYYTCASGDREAFEAWAKSPRFLREAR